MKFYKCTRNDGTDFYTGTINYAQALNTKTPIEIDAEPPNGGVCGHGLHVSPTAQQTIKFAERKYRTWRWFEVKVNKSDIVESDLDKSRVRKLTVTKEIFIEDIFGKDLVKRIKLVKKEVETWKNIPWNIPSKDATEEKLKELFKEWHKGISVWSKKELPKKMKVVSTKNIIADVSDAADVVDAVVDAVDADADVAVNAADVVVNAVADIVADIVADVVDAFTVDDAAAAAKWYVHPYNVLRYYIRWILVNIDKPNFWKPLIKMCKLGCIPIGYVNGEFVIYKNHN